MSWDDWVFGALTGGLYNVGKTVYQVGEAADAAGDAVEEISDGAGTALAAIGSTITKLGKDLSSFIKELEEMVTVRRVTPRDTDDLWDEEVERLSALREREAELLAELAALQAEDDDRSWFDSLWDSIFGGASYEELAVRTKLAVIRGAIHEILYEEPGVIPTSIHNVQLILERFNTLEQPRLEEILDSINDNLEESEGILAEVKKLFVVKTWKAVPIAELPALQRERLEVLEASLARYDTLIAKSTAVSGQLQQALVQAQPAKFPLLKMVGTSLRLNSEGDEGNPAAPPDASLGGGGAAAAMPPIHGEPVPRKVLPSGPSFAIKGKVAAVAATPMAVSVATALNQNVVAGYLDNHSIVDGRIRFYMRERLKIEKEIHVIKWVPVEEPGVIPRVLEEIEGTIERFRTESQPRIETVLDSVNATVVEATAVLSSLNTSLGSVQGAFDTIAKYSLWIKIGLGVSAGLSVLILLMSLIVLFRLAFGI